MASFLSTLSKETAKLRFRDFALFGALAAILSKSFRDKVKRPKFQVSGASLKLKSPKKPNKRKISKR